MAEFPALPVWTDAYLADTTHLGDAEHGRYFLILMHLWRTPGQRFPNDMAWLARKFGRSAQAFENEVFPIMREFMKCDGNWWRQKRLTAEWEYVQKSSAAQRDRANKRWHKDKLPSPTDAAPHQSGNAPTPTPTPTIDSLPSLRSDKESHVQPKRVGRVSNGFSVSELVEFELWYAEYPRHEARGAAEKSFRTARKQVALDQLIEGARRYGRSTESAERKFIKLPATWLNAKCWADGEASSSNGHSKTNGHVMDVTKRIRDEPWEQRVAGFRRSGLWRNEWGFPPGESGCRVPDELLLPQELSAKGARAS